jgi:hydroxymethylpyrimidine/phosphomethylpyrimidine kinase
MAKALTIAGSDSSSGAGIQADLKVFSLMHVYGTSVITALTAQNTKRVSRVMPVEPAMIKSQINSVIFDIKIDAIKIGMVYSKDIINAIASALKNVSIPIILDPIFKAGTGAILLRNDAYASFVKKLVPMAYIITPNRMEAEKLANMKINGVADAKNAAEKIANLGARNVIIKGGHLEGKYAIDILYHNKRFFEYANERVKSKGFHGAGCAFSAALTAEIAKGKYVIDATKRANEFINNAISNELKIGKGMSVLNFEQLPSSNALLATLQKAVYIVEDTDNFGLLIPESQTNIVYAKEKAQSTDDVAGVYGRIVKIGNRAKASGNVGFGASKHVASAVLAIIHHDKSVRSAANIKYDERIIEICRSMGWKVSSYDRRCESEEMKSKEGKTVKWGIEQAIAKINALPDVIYHTGDWGKEPMVLVFGKDPYEVCNKVISILNQYKI